MVDALTIEYSFIMTPMLKQRPPYWLHSLRLVSGPLFLLKTYAFSNDLDSRYGLVGLLRPLTVYPSEMVYWYVSIDENTRVPLSIPHNNIIFRTYRSFLSSKVLPCVSKVM